MKLFQDVTQSQDMVQTEDRLGGFAPLPSDVYDCTIEMVYIGNAQHSKSQSFTIHLRSGGHTHQETIWITDRENKHYYIKEGKKYPLPGFVTIDDMCLLVTGYPLSELGFEEKTVKIYDYDAKAEIPKSVMVPIQLMGQKITAAILQETHDKNKKNDATGQYEATGETRVASTVVKFFHPEMRKTVNEIRNNHNPTFLDAWVDKYKGQVRNRSKGKPGDGQGKPGAPGGMARPQPTNTANRPAAGSLFGKP